MSVGASKYSGMRRIFARFFPNLPEKTPKKWLPKKRIICWAPFCSYFQGVCEGFQRFARILNYFSRILRDFGRISTKPKLLGVRLHPLHPHLLHQCIHLCEDTDHANAIFRTGPRTTHVARGVTRLDGARGKNKVWCSHVQSWGLSEANVLYWRKYLRHCWDFSAPPAVIRRPGNCAPRPPRYAPMHMVHAGAMVPAALCRLPLVQSNMECLELPEFRLKTFSLGELFETSFLHYFTSSKPG